VRKLTVDDIIDMRAYERERDELRKRIIDLKRIRRVALGPIMTIVFENTLTMRWQIQEMARVERMLRDEQIAHEVETYNQLIPDAGELSATVMIELTSEPALREWLPRLVGIQNHVAVVLPDGTSVPGEPSAEDQLRLTRDDITAAVHFLKFRFSPADIEMFASGPVHIVVNHPEYDQDIQLEPEQHAELLADLQDAS
jgi:type II secretory pathway component PulL